MILLHVHLQSLHAVAESGRTVGYGNTLMAFSPVGPVYASIRKVYRKLPFSQRLFIAIRCLVVPWQKVVGALADVAPKTILDIGCGHGLFLHLVKNKFPGTVCWGVEHDEKKLETVTSASASHGVSLLSWDTFSKNNPGKVDCVSIVDVLCCIPLDQWNGILNLAANQLNSGGILFVKDAIDRPRWKYFVTNFQEICAAKIFRFTKGAWPHHESVENYIRQMQSCGFEVIHHERIDRGYPWSHYLFVARKKA